MFQHSQHKSPQVRIRLNHLAFSVVNIQLDLAPFSRFNIFHFLLVFCNRIVENVSALICANIHTFLKARKAYSLLTAKI